MFFLFAMRLSRVMAAFWTALTLGWDFRGFSDDSGETGKLLIHLFAAIGAIGSFACTAFNQQFLHFAAGWAFVFKYGHNYRWAKSPPYQFIHHFYVIPSLTFRACVIKDRRFGRWGQG
jgi:hypothetical protein